VVCDASFIGLAKVLDVPLKLAAPDCRLVALIKPQFEVGRSEVGKGGVVRDRRCMSVSAARCAIGWKVWDSWSTASSKARSPARKAMSSS
jgi:23S rRNA (cytidine1920-2'-O)/16S rRNA (cytidine1409-2'-O)-methyltransferase